MKTNFQYVLIILVFFSCTQKEMPLDYQAAIGMYKATHKEGEEELTLNPDNSYLYKFNYMNGEVFSKSGTWEFTKQEAIINFFEWPMIVFPEFLTKEKYIESRRYWGKTIDPDEDVIIKKYPMNFATTWEPFKRVYVLRRNFDLHGFDLVKIE